MVEKETKKMRVKKIQSKNLCENGRKMDVKFLKKWPKNGRKID